MAPSMVWKGLHPDRRAVSAVDRMAASASVSSPFGARPEWVMKTPLAEAMVLRTSILEPAVLRAIDLKQLALQSQR